MLAPAAQPHRVPWPSHRTAHRRAVDAYETRAVLRLARLGLPVYCGGSHGDAVALTFDDGPGPYTLAALRLLRRAHARATFFLVGRQVGWYPSVVRRERDREAIGDHTWTHAWLPALGRRALVRQLGWTRAAIHAVTGRRVVLFRPPYGARTRAIDRTARRLGMLEVLWDVDSRDSAGANPRQIARNVLQALRPGAIILMHENRGQTFKALKRRILPALRRRRLRAVTLPELLAVDPPSRKQLRLGSRACPPPGVEHP